MTRPPALLLPLYAVVALLAVSCMTPGERAAEADQEVYAIVAEKRAQLASFDPFTIDNPGLDLRDVLYAGEVIEPLDLADLLLVAAENSRQYQTEREDLYLAALDFTFQRFLFSAIEAADTAVTQTGLGDDTTSASLMNTLGLTKLFETGMVIAADVGLDLLATDFRGSWADVSSAALSITQPLWRGSDPDFVTEDLVQAERDVLYQARSYERFRRVFAVSVANEFFDVLLQGNILENERENYRGLVRLRERNEAFAQAGRLNEIQVDQAQQDELRARDRVIAAERRLQTRLDDFKLVLGLPPEAVLPVAPGDWLTLEAWPFLEVVIDEPTAIRVSLAERLDHATTIDRLGDELLDVRIAADNLRAGVSAVASGSNASAFDDFDDYDKDTLVWTLGLDIDWPVALLPERNAYRAALIDEERAERAVEQSRDTIIADIRAQRRNLEAARQSYEIQVRAVELAERRVESTELNLEAGRASTRDVLESQESLVNARNAETSALVSYILSGLALYRDMELLRVTPEGISVDLTPVDLLEEDNP